MTAQKLLGLKIREARKKRVLTQSELADRAGLSLQHVGDIERGEANPTLSCLQKIAEVLDVAVSDFFVKDEGGGEPTEREMRDHLLNFISKAGKKHLYAFYMLYRGMKG